jgi:hypothetical protein
VIGATRQPFYPGCGMCPDGSVGMCPDGSVMVRSSEQLSQGCCGEIKTHYSHVNATLFLKMLKLGCFDLLSSPSQNASIFCMR